MKTYHKIIAGLLLSIFSFAAFAQNKDDAKGLVKQGTTLHDEGKYEEAIGKYNEAIKADPDYATAYYELGYTMFITGRGRDAIPYMEKALKLDPKLVGAYDVLGSIYDDNKQFDKAVDYYKQGIKADPNYQMLYYNLAISCFRQGKYEDAEANVVQSIKLNPKHASSQRAYAMIAFKQNRRGVSLLAFSSFLLLEPQTKRSVEAFNYIKYFLNYGIKRDSAKNVNLTISSGDTESGNLALAMSVLAATSDKKDLNTIDSLKLQLKSAYDVSGTFSMNKHDDFYLRFYADYFKKLAQTDNMPAFTRLISLTAYKDENLKWFKENDKQLSALEAWLGGQERKF
jgi:tetratricopeptide (TPR) repeat protein